MDQTSEKLCSLCFQAGADDTIGAEKRLVHRKCAAYSVHPLMTTHAFLLRDLEDKEAREESTQILGAIRDAFSRVVEPLKRFGEDSLRMFQEEVRGLCRYLLAVGDRLDTYSGVIEHRLQTAEEAQRQKLQPRLVFYRRAVTAIQSAIETIFALMKEYFLEDFDVVELLFLSHKERPTLFEVPLQASIRA